jgi:hypothetical protein
MDRYRKQGSGDRPFYIQGYSGGPFNLDRKSRPTQFVPDLLFNIVGGIQPDLAQQVLASGPDDGMTARFACVWPAVPADWQMKDRWPNRSARAALDRLNERLVAADWNRELQHDDFSELPFCRLSPEGQLLFDAWYTALMRELRGPDAPEGRLGVRLGKYPGFVVRQMLVFNLVEWAAGRGSARQVSTDVVANVLELATGYWRPMDERVYAQFATPFAAQAGRRIARWLLEKRIEQFTARDVYRHEWSECAEPEDAEVGIEWLAAHHWVVEEDKRARPGRPSNVFLVNPLVHER